MKNIVESGNEYIGSGRDHDHGNSRDVAMIIVTACLLGLYWFGWLPQLLGINTALIAALVCGFPIVKEAVVAIIRQGDTKVGLLVSIAIIAAMAIGEYFAAAEVALIMTIGEMLEHMTLEKSNSALRKLAELAPLKARRMVDGQEEEIAAELVHTGDRLLVKPGEKIPVDGDVISGIAVVDQSAITGEAMPLERGVGDAVFGGTVLQKGSLEILATRVGRDTALGHIVQMVEQAQQSKAPISRIIDRWAGWFVPLSLGIAALVYAVTGDIVRGVTILIVFCPCAMLLSTPTAVAAAIGLAARRGVLIKGGEVLEQIGHIDTVLFDKTGTVTVGRPALSGIHCYGAWQRREVLAIAAGMEKRSEHHLAKAVLEAAAQEEIEPQEPEEWHHAVGQGVWAVIAGRTYLLGNHSLLENNGVMLSAEQQLLSLEKQEQGATTVYFAADGEIKAIITIIDPLRERAKETIAALKETGIQNIVLVTGDTSVVGNAVGKKLQLAKIHGDLLPGDKVRFVKEYQDKGHKVLMVGDGVNDAPALATAQVGVAMGCGGTNVAMEAAGVTLLAGELSKITGIMKLSKQTIKTIHQNIVVANFINICAIGFAAFGLMGPVAAAIVHNLGAILVILNSARLLSSDSIEN